MKDKRDLTDPCGLDCFNCELYEEIRKEYFKGRFIIGKGQAD